MRKLSATEDQLQQIQERLGKWNGFIAELQVPADIAPAMMTGRLELLKLAKPRPLSTVECAVLYQLIGGLLETNQALQQHSSLVANIALDVRQRVSSIDGTASRLEAYANFRLPHDDDEDES